MIQENDTLLQVKDKINHQLNGYWTVDEEGLPVYVDGYKDKVNDNEADLKDMSNDISDVAVNGLTSSLIEDSTARVVTDTEKTTFATNAANSIKYNSTSGKLELNSVDVTKNFAVAAGWHKDPKHRTNLYITSAYENEGNTSTAPEPFITHRPRIAFQNLTVTSSEQNYGDERYIKDFKYQNVIENIGNFLDKEAEHINLYIPSIVFKDDFLHNNTVSSTCEVWNQLDTSTNKYKVHLKFWSNHNLVNQTIPLVMFTTGVLYSQ